MYLSKKTFIDRQKDEIEKVFSGIKSLFLDGFLFFDDFQKYLIEVAIKKGVIIYLISKQFSDGSGDFILNDNLKIITEKFHLQPQKIFEDNLQNKNITALDYIKKRYPISNSVPPNDINAYCYKAINSILNYRFDVLSLKTVFATIEIKNIRSIKLVAKMVATIFMAGARMP